MYPRIPNTHPLYNLLILPNLPLKFESLQTTKGIPLRIIPRNVELHNLPDIHDSEFRDDVDAVDFGQPDRGFDDLVGEFVLGEEIEGGEEGAGVLDLDDGFALAVICDDARDGEDLGFVGGPVVATAIGLGYVLDFVVGADLADWQ